MGRTDTQAWSQTREEEEGGEEPQTPRGGGRKTERGPLALFPRWLWVQSVTIPHLMNGWVSHYSQIFSPFCHKKKKKKKKNSICMG